MLYLLAIQLVVVLALLVLAFTEVRALLVDGRVDVDAIARAARRDRRVLALLEGTQLAALVPLAKEGVAEADIVEAMHLVDRRLEGRVAALRVLGHAGGALAFATIAASVAWIDADHGLRGLDAGAIRGEASLGAAWAITLAFGGSSFAIAVTTRLRGVARQTSTKVRQLLDRLAIELAR